MNIYCSECGATVYNNITEKQLHYFIGVNEPVYCEHCQNEMDED